MCKTIKQKVRLKASPDTVYETLVNSQRRSALTGSEALISPNVGGPFSTDDGRVTGVNVDLVPGTRLVQAWRRDDFPSLP